MIQNIGFIDTSVFTATFVLKHKAKLLEGVLALRTIKSDDADASDTAIMADWKSGRALLTRLRVGAAPYFDGKTPTLGRAWIEHLPPRTATPWLIEDDDYADAHVRTRTCLIQSPSAASFCGVQNANLLVGIVTALDMRQLCSEANFSDYPRTHLVVDVKRPPEE